MITKEEYKILEMKQKEYLDICEHLGLETGTIESLAIMLLYTQNKPNTTNNTGYKPPTQKKDYSKPVGKENEKIYNDKITPSDLNEIRYHTENNPDMENMVSRYLDYTGRTLEGLKQGQGIYLLKKIKEKI